MKIDRNLLKKYNTPTPRYTSYPPANFFSSDFEYEKAIEIIKISNSKNPQNLSFYIHIPFCSQLCYYCGCNTIISKDKNIIKNYVDLIKKEILLYRKFIDPNRKISQIHWGGGTPNYLDINLIEEIMQIFFDNFNFIENPEIAMECHPAHLSLEYIDILKSIGFNRLSIGVQDIHNDILNSVHRQLPAMEINKLVSYLHSKNFSVNLDFIYGLPKQNTKNFAETIKQAADLNADRLAIFSYAHVPWVKPHQKILEKFELPDAQEKISMFEIAYEILTHNEYVSIGLDHFAKPQDELSIALKNKNLHRNFQGYCTRRTTAQVYALGVSGITQLSDAYLQNTKILSKYEQNIKNDTLPLEKAYFISSNEKIISEIITQIMCNRYINLNFIAKKFNISIEKIKKITKLDENKILQFENEKLLTYSNNEIIITQKGMFFLRNIASSFDPLMNTTNKKFSKSL